VWLAVVASKDKLIYSVLVLFCRQPVIHRYRAPLAEVPESKPKLTCDKIFHMHEEDKNERLRFDINTVCPQKNKANNFLE